MRRIDNQGRMSIVSGCQLGDNATLSDMIEKFKAYSNKKYKYND